MLYREGLTDSGYNFQVEILSLVDDFCTWLEEQGYKFESEIQIALMSFFVLLELREALNELINDYQKLPVFKNLSPLEAYETLKREMEKERKKVVNFKTRKKRGGDRD